MLYPKIVRSIDYGINIDTTLPTTVEPVKEIFLTIGFSHNILPTSPALDLEHVTIFNTPGGRPAFSAS